MGSFGPSEVQDHRRLKYRFHLIDKNGEMVFRYDNAPHHDNSTFPHHKHHADCVVESEERESWISSMKSSI
ncbi:toxin-antitoxin system TumE family protein [Methanothrix sp.]